MAGGPARGAEFNIGRRPFRFSILAPAKRCGGLEPGASKEPKATIDAFGTEFSAFGAEFGTFGARAERIGAELIDAFDTFGG